MMDKFREREKSWATIFCSDSVESSAFMFSLDSPLLSSSLFGGENYGPAENASFFHRSKTTETGVEKIETYSSKSTPVN